MKKMLNKILFLAFSIIFLSSLVSANGYSDNTYIPNSVYCSDSDRGVYSTIKGTVNVSSKQYVDTCYTPDTVYEYYCSGTTYGVSYIKCPSGFSCSNGVCVSVPVVEKLNMSVATLKDTYKVGETVELTDPPDDEVQEVISSSSDKPRWQKIINFFKNKITGKATFSIKSKCNSYSKLFDDKDAQEDPLILTDRIINASNTLCFEEKSRYNSQIKSLISKRKDLLIEKMKKGDVCLLYKVKSLPNSVTSKISLNDEKNLIEKESEFTGFVDVIHSDDFENPENSKYQYYLRNNAEKYELFSPDKLQLSLANSKVKMKGKSIGDKMAVGTAKSNGCGDAESSAQIQGGLTGKVVDSSTSTTQDITILQGKTAYPELNGKKYSVYLKSVSNTGTTAIISIDGTEKKIEESGKYTFGELNVEVFDINYEYDTELRRLLSADVTLRLSVSEPDIIVISQPKRPVDENIGPQKTLVIIANIGDKKAPVTVEEAKRLVFGNEVESVNDFYINNSYGKTWLVGDIFGPYTISEPIPQCDIVKAVLDKAFKNKDIIKFNYSRLILAIPCNVCMWCGGGSASVGKWSNLLPNGEYANFSISWDFSFDLGTVGHELGHNFGAKHANSYICTNKTGSLQSFSYECSSNEYGDNFDIMGYSVSHGSLNAAHRSELGWLPVQNTKKITGGTYILKPINIAQPLGTLQQLLIPISTETSFYIRTDNVYYSIEFRRPSNYDDFYINEYPDVYEGVFIRLAAFDETGDFTFDQTNLLHQVFDDSYIDSYTLKIGKSFIDTINGYIITLDNIDVAGAHVTIKNIPPTLPDLSKPLVYYDFSSISYIEKTQVVEDKAGYIRGGIVLNGEVKSGGFYLFSNKEGSGENNFSFISMNRFPEVFFKKNNAFTFSLWVNSYKSNEEALYFMGFDNILSIDYNKHFRFMSLYAGEGEENGHAGTPLLSSTVISPDNWYHVVGVFNGSDYMLYINGKKENSFNPTSDIFNPDLIIIKYHLFIEDEGIKSVIGDNYYRYREYKEVIDEFKVWARALNDTEVIQEYKSFVPLPVHWETPPQSKLSNLGTTDVTGKLNILIQQYNPTTNTWTTRLDKSVISYPVTVKANGGIVKLDQIFNSKKISLSQTGKYRVIATFISSKGAKAESIWEFGVV